ncbi:MAG TPA: O-antigen ligase family protein [Phycisphaerales bacterium]|nr:O-antigen ligase family protein [Phycisphaerales bacterium]|tara:strand:- start:358 stop:2127 length:1770 start_codon:yes stop_codon:yes gene_type:complete
MITKELPSGVLGPSGSVLLDVIILALCSLALLGETLRGRMIHWYIVGLAALPIVVIWTHGSVDPLQYIHGSAWIAAIMASITLAHLCREQRVFVLAVIVLLALTIPLLVSAVFAYGDHEQLIRYFESHKREVLGMNGLKYGTSAAAIFEERLRSFGPMGWFSSPNVFGGVLVGLAVIWAFIAASWCKNRILYFVIAGLFSLLCCAAAISTSSKTTVVLVLVAFIFVLSMYTPLTRSLLKKRGGWIAVSIVVASVYVVFFRGYLAESFLGDRSLFVRSQYFIGGLEIAGTHLFGVGPDHIQESWLTVRPETATEEITSTHNIVFDWLVSYSIFGFFWIAIFIKLLWNAGKKLWFSDPINHRQVFASGLGLAAIIVVISAQVDLLMFDLGSTLFAFCLLGIGGTLSIKQTRSKIIDASVSMIPFVIGCVVLYFGFVPLAHDEYLQKNAAKSLIAGESVVDVATNLADQSLTRESTLIAAKLFLAAGHDESVIKILKNIEPTSIVWYLRCKAASTSEEALIAAQKLGHIDPNGLQTALLLADCLWETQNVDYPLGYDRAAYLNEKYQIDPTRALSGSALNRVNQRCLTKRRR